MANEKERVRASATVASVIMGTFGKEDRSCLAVTFDIADSRFPSLSKRYFFSSDSEDMMKKDLTALGWNPEKRGWAIEEIVNDGVINGKPCSLTIENDPEWGWQVKWIDGTERPAVKRKFSTDEVKDFAQRLRSKMGIKPGDQGIPF